MSEFDIKIFKIGESLEIQGSSYIFVIMTGNNKNTLLGPEIVDIWSEALLAEHNRAMGDMNSVAGSACTGSAYKNKDNQILSMDKEGAQDVPPLNDEIFGCWGMEASFHQWGL